MSTSIFFYCRLFSTFKYNVSHCFFLSFRSHVNQTSGWLPPADTWEASQQQQQQQQHLNGGAVVAAEPQQQQLAAPPPPLPYGWEAATDKDGRPYYVK